MKDRPITQLTELPLPADILALIDALLPMPDKAHCVSVCRSFHHFFRPEISKEAANLAAAHAIYPMEENVEALTFLLQKCPELLNHTVTVKNRHGQAIRGTVYQIALHEGDDKLIEDVIKPAFKKLDKSLEKMEAQRQAWLPDGWEEREKKACAKADEETDRVFAAFKEASDPADVTESEASPFPITITKSDVTRALKDFRRAVDALHTHTPTDAVITSGRDPSIRLLERVNNLCLENHAALGGDDAPRTNALARMVFGYCQRSAPINFMQAFAGVLANELTRSLEYRYWAGHSILPLDSDPLVRLGFDHYACAGRDAVLWGSRIAAVFQNFFQSKTAAILQSCVMRPKDWSCAVM